MLPFAPTPKVGPNPKRHVACRDRAGGFAHLLLEASRWLARHGLNNSTLARGPSCRVPLHDVGLHQRKIEFLPAMEATLQRTDARDPDHLKFLRHPGTAGFVGSSTVENDLLVPGQRRRLAGDVIGQHADGAGDETGRVIEKQGLIADGRE